MTADEVAMALIMYQKPLDLIRRTTIEAMMNWVVGAVFWSLPRRWLCLACCAQGAGIHKDDRVPGMPLGRRATCH